MYATINLSKIESDIKKGLKYRAADRLRNLINEYPDELGFRSNLAELYYYAGFLDAAGKYWIFEESNQQRIQQCVKLYRESVNNSGCQILRDVKFRGNKSDLNEYSLKILLDLEKDSELKTNSVPRFYLNEKSANRKVQTKKPDSLQKKIIEKVVIGFLIAIPILAIVGIVTTLRWLFY